MNEVRLKNVFYHIRGRIAEFDMNTMDHDFGYYAACVAIGDDLHGRRVVEYRGQEMHVHDVAT
ncbi:MAG: hypothetical protein ACHQX3_09385, partial [Nitrospirales bacterium]